MSTAEFKVDGMKCTGCSGRLKRALEATAGVASASVVLDTKQVSVEYDGARIDEAALKRVVQEGGFTVLAA